MTFGTVASGVAECTLSLVGSRKGDVMVEALRVLVLESEIGAADVAVAELETAGHTVVRCHDADGPAFPCRGVLDPAQCPVEHEALDVALTVRADPLTQPAPTEDGVSCALRHRIPVVVAGNVVLNPFEDYATAVVTTPDGVVDACEQVTEQPLTEHTARANRMLDESLERHGVAGLRRAAVHRRDGGLVVSLEMPPETSHAVRNLVAMKVFEAVRAYDPDAFGIDIVIAA